jgi:hypothetical protein
METLDNLPPSMDWQVYKNDTTTMTLVLVDTNNNALDLTDWDFAGHVKQLPSDTLVLDVMGIVKNENVLTIALTSTNLDVMNYFDIEGINTVTGKVSTILTGTIYVQEDVTRL